MNKHTPGPWRWVYAYQCRGTHWCLENDEHARRGLTIDHRLVTLGTEEYDYDDDGNATRLDQTPNFLLIAAAPELLTALEGLVEWADTDTLNPEGTLQRRLLVARDAIIKARNGTTNGAKPCKDDEPPH